MAKYTLEYAKSARAKCRRWVTTGDWGVQLPCRESQIHATEGFVVQQLTDAEADVCPSVCTHNLIAPLHLHL